jgi:dipeptidase E
MPTRQLLLLSNSRDAQGRFLHYPREAIRDHLGPDARITFVPYAGVTVSLDDYVARVREAVAGLGYQIHSVHETDDPAGAIRDADAIAVGGGNTFQLLRRMYETGLLDAIRERVAAGVPYVGWSAGSLITCPTIRTTNDMPIVEPPSLSALGLMRFQINAHYTDFHAPGFQGETRVQRLTEFLELNREAVVVALPEGTMLRVQDERVTFLGDVDGYIFRHGRAREQIAPGTDLHVESDLAGAAR